MAYTVGMKWKLLSCVCVLTAAMSGQALSAGEPKGLSRDAAEAEVLRYAKERGEQIAHERAEELADNTIVLGEHVLRFERRSFGDPGPKGTPLWISMHGGGNAPEEVNDQQWANQQRLYEPSEGIYLAPRAPSNTWNLWHREEVDRLFDRLIETAISVWDVDPDRVYLMGYSAGGDGVYQLAPRMADRFAAAAMMAGHPNDASPLGLRNLPFALYMGGDDAAYNRNEVAAKWATQLAALQRDDEAGYVHRVQIYPGVGHWMNRRDAEALPWMAKHTRTMWPKRIVWQQGNVTHQRFYWLQVAPDDAIRGRTIIAHVDGQTIYIESEKTSRITVLLRDDLLDLDQPVSILANDQVVFEGVIQRKAQVIAESLDARNDTRAAATARVSVNWSD